MTSTFYREKCLDKSHEIYIFFLFRGLFIIDDKGVLRQITMNDLPVSHYDNLSCCQLIHYCYDDVVDDYDNHYITCCLVLAY